MNAGKIGLAVGVRGLLAVVLAAPLAVSAAADGGTADRQGGLVGWWCFDECTGATVTDLTGHGYDGSTYGSPTWRSGVDGCALEFLEYDGVWLPSTFDDGVRNFTVAAWVRWYGHPYGGAYLFDTRGTGVSSGFFVHLRPEGNIVLSVYRPGPSQDLVSRSVLQIDRWAHVAAVFDYDAGVMRLYKDGQRDELTLPIIDRYYPSDWAGIGNARWNDWPITGTVDEVRFYDQALTDQQVYELCWNTPAAPPPWGDMNCDGRLDFEDINPFVLAITNCNAYERQYPGCWGCMNADIDGDGEVDFADVNPFVALLSGT